MERDERFLAAVVAARERAERTGRTSYIWFVEDGPGAESRYIVTGSDDTVTVEGQQQATIAGLVSGTGHNSRPTCWRGVCSIPQRDPDEGILTRRETVSPLLADREPEDYDGDDPRL